MRNALVLSVVGTIAVVGAPASRIDAAGGGLDARSTPPRILRPAGETRPPCDFEKNCGQTAPQVDLVARCAGYVAFLTGGDAVIRTEREALRLHVVGGRAVKARATDPRPGRTNYFVGQDPSRWTAGIAHVGRVEYADVLPGVDLVYRTHGRELVFDLVLAGGADAAALRLRIEGAKWLGPDAAGGLSIGLPGGGSARLSAPRAWQGDGPSRRDVPVAFARGDGADDVAFQIGAHDPSARLVIDPSFTVSTYHGGTNTDQASSIRTDASGAVYLTGQTYSIDFPTTTGVLQGAKGEISTTATDAFVTELDPYGGSLVFSTYLGGGSNDSAGDVAIDSSSGAVYVGGTTSSSNFPLSGAYQSTPASGFLTKLTSSGGALSWSTYYGQPTTVMGLDSSGNVHCFNTAGRAFAFNSSGTTLVYAVTAGATGPAYTWTSMAVDPSGAVWLGGAVGTSGGTSYATSGAYQSAHAGGVTDGYLVKLNSSGSQVYATYLGGSGDDIVRSVALDPQGAVLVAGSTSSGDFPRLNALQTARGGGTDAFVTKMNSAATGLTFSTYLGGSGTDDATAVVANANSQVFVVGSTASSDFPTYVPFQPAYGGAGDAFVAEIGPTGLAQSSSYVGGSSVDAAVGVAVSATGRPWVAGTTSSSDFPSPCAIQTSLLGAADVFLVGVTVPSAAYPDVSFTVLAEATATRSYSAQLTIPGGTAPLTWTLVAGTMPAGLTLSSSGVLSGTPNAGGTTPLFVKVVDTFGACTVREFRLTVNPVPTVPNSSLAAWTVDRPYGQAIPRAGGTFPFAWNLQSGSPPPGTSVETDGFLSGTPTSAGAYAFTPQVVDAQGASANGSISVVIHPAPQITTTTLPPWTQFQTYKQTLTASDGTPSYAWSLVSGTSPVDTSIDPAKGTIDGVTRAAGDYSFTVSLRDVAGATAAQTVTMRVNADPSLTTASLPMLAVGRPLDVAMALSDGTAPFIWSVSKGTLPAGVQQTDTTGRLFGIPSQPGKSTVEFRVTDVAGARGTRSYDFVIVPRIGFSKTKASASLTFAAPGDDVRFLELLGGTLLDVSITVKKGQHLPQIVLLDAAEKPLDLAPNTKEKPTSVVVKGFAVPATGRYFLVLRPTGGLDPAKLTIVARPTTKWSAKAVPLDPSPNGPPILIPFSAPPGSMLVATTAAVKHSGSIPTIGSVKNALGTELLVFADRKVTKNGASLKASSPLAGGDYVLTIFPNGGAPGNVTWTVSVKPPKDYDFALPDLAVSRQ